MKIKVDDVVKREVALSGLTNTKIASLLKVHRNTVNNILNNPEMELKYIIALGKAIRYDFTKHFPEIESVKHLAEEEEEKYDKMSDAALREQHMILQAKHIELQEKYIALLEEYNKLKEG